MMKIKYPFKGFNINWFLLVFWTFLQTFCYSQVLNGSFEVEGQPSLEHWINSCGDDESFQDAPVGGGSWCLRLPEGNFQGCFPETANQFIPEFKNGDIWQISVWARQYEKKISQTSLILKIFNKKIDVSTVFSTDTTTSNDWIQLIIVDTLFLEEGDSVAIILDAGITSGPQLFDSYSYFDLVEAKKIGQNDFLPKEFKLFQNIPNPFNPSTRIKYSIPQSSNVIIKVFDILGNEIETLVNEEKPTGTYELTWNATNLPSGIYFYRLQVYAPGRAGSFVETKKMVLMK